MDSLLSALLVSVEFLFLSSTWSIFLPITKKIKQFRESTPVVNMFDVLRSRTSDAKFLPWYKKLPEDEGEADQGYPDDDHALLRSLHKRFSFKLIAISGLGLTLCLSGLYLLYSQGKNKVQFTPELRTTPVEFAADPLFMAEPSPESNAAWDSLMPSGRGFVLVENPEDYGLGPGVPTDVGPDRYSISMFHQLHCLGMIRESYYAMVRQERPDIYGQELLSDEEQKETQRTHIGHCFDYIRQAIMCAGDLTLEGLLKTPSGELGSSVDGWGITHQCRSWDQAVSWTQQHKAPHNHTGIA
ncbi:hypothetical protein F4810DRAFT_433128 [Camillea tinctor]|nr:hypothetical protein F4810DRAFT_433128 [Camillea tinctor]